MKTYDDKRYSDITTFKIGGSISELLYPETLHDAVEAYDGCDIVGNGSNILATDTDHGKVLCTKRFDEISQHGNDVVFQCGVMNYNAIKYCMDAGFTGLEFLTGIPGTIGGAVMTNAGFYGNSIGNYVKWVTCIKEDNLTIISGSDIVFERRHCSLSDDKVFVLEVCLSLPSGDREFSKRLIREFISARNKNQTHKHPSAGGVFKNYKLLAGKIPDNTITCGGARLYVDQPNFIFNYDNATFDDVESIIYYAMNIEPRLELEINVKR